MEAMARDSYNSGINHRNNALKAEDQALKQNEKDREKSLQKAKDEYTKALKDFKLIGTAVRNVDNKDMITGKPLYGMDFYREGMLTAMIQRPAFGMKLKSVDSAAAKAMPGIIDVVSFKNNVAVVGKSTWQINKARKALKIEYEVEGAIESTADHDKLFKDLLNNGQATVRRKDGDGDGCQGPGAGQRPEHVRVRQSHRHSSNLQRLRGCRFRQPFLPVPRHERPLVRLVPPARRRLDDSSVARPGALRRN
jgi:CO/xanthine dehydrogenase Mo-binding subunit